MQKSGDAFYQRVIYTPNAECSVHRDIIIEKTAYDKADMGETGVINLLKTDRAQDPYWNQYGVDNATWSADPNTTYYACSLAKNINEEWGPLVKVEFTTGNGESESKVTVPMRLENSTSHGVTTMPIITGKKAQAKFQMISELTIV